MRAVLIRNLKKYTFTSLPPLGLGYLAASLNRRGIDTKIVDIGHRGETSQKLFDELADAPPDLVGISSFSRDFAITKSFIEEMSRHLPAGVPVLMGGPHPSAQPEQTLKSIPRVDIAVSGEGEESLPRFAQTLGGGGAGSWKDIPGLTWRENGENGSIRGNPPVFPQDLDAFGHIDWDAMQPRSYLAENLAGGSRRTPAACLVTSRGCPYACEFCTDHIVFGRRTRRHSIDYILEDVEILHKKHGFREIRILDDNFPVHKDYTLEFCKRVRERNWDLAFSFPLGMHLRLIDGEMLDALKSIGVYEITTGIEAASSRVQKLMKKRITPELVREKIQLIHRKGLDIVGLFIIGYPTETRAEVEETFRLTRKLPFTRVHFHPFIPFPGTPISKKLEEAGKLKPVAWDHWHFDRVYYSFCEIPAKELHRMRWKGMALFYLRPRTFWKLMIKWRSLSQFRFFLHKIFAYL